MYCFDTVFVGVYFSWFILPSRFMRMPRFTTEKCVSISIFWLGRARCSMWLYYDSNDHVITVLTAILDKAFLFYFTGTTVRQAKKVAYAGKVEKFLSQDGCMGLRHALGQY